jgi:glycosyltransferase involved in cell wall biosynthesis
VGDGSGVEPLRHIAGDNLGSFIHMTGRVPREDVPKYLAAMDIGSLPQSVDQVGSFRFTTKISEYFAAKLPFIATQIPAAYDLDAGGIHRLGGKTPWDPAFISNLARFMENITPAWVADARASIPESMPEFDRQKQLERFRAFLCELVAQ